MKKFIFIIFICTLFLALESHRNNDGKIAKQDSFSNCSSYPVDNKLPKILRVLTARIFGGIEQQTFTAYKYLLEKGYDINLLTIRGSGIEKELLSSRLPFHCLTRRQDLIMELTKMYSNKKFDIIHCHKYNEYPVVRDFSKKNGISCIAHYHSHNYPQPNLFKGFDAFVASSPNVFNFMREANKKYDLGIKYVEFIHPPHNEESFLNFEPKETKINFFKNNFNVDVKGCTVICMIANLCIYKNHILLLKAIAKVIHEYKFQVEVCLAGIAIDVSKASLIQLAVDLGISKHIHFLGFTKLIPELLYYSDINTLTSRREAFGIVLMEAALMKKPIILSRGADLAGILIQHEKTGLLCDSSDPDDLARQIKRLIQNSGFAKILGENAYQLVTREFSNKAALDKFEKLYKCIYADKISKKNNKSAKR